MSFEKETKRDHYFSVMEKEVLALLDPTTLKPRPQLVEAANCPVCDISGFPTIEKWGFTYDRCPACDCFFTNPRLKESAIIEIYKEGSQANQLWAEAVHQSDRQRQINLEYFDDQLNFLDNSLKAGSVCDVGCGTGDFLDRAKLRGWEGLGLEISKNAVSLARQKGHQVLEVLIGNKQLQGRSFDLVTMFGVMEHLFQPKRDFVDLAKMVKPGGYFLGITPNAFSLVGMLLHEKARFFTPRNHPVIFSMTSVRKLVESAGFEVLKLDTVLTGRESILNHLNYTDAFEGHHETLPKDLGFSKLLGNEAEFGKLLHKFDLGLRIRVLAKKANDNP